MDTDTALKLLITTMNGLRLTRDERVPAEAALQRVMDAVSAEREAAKKKAKPEGSNGSE